jgi:hypothetical protein
MAESIDVHDLPEEEIFLGVCPLGIMRKLRRREIYD